MDHCNPPRKECYLEVGFSTNGDSINEEEQIFQVLKEAQSGVPVSELCRKYGMGNATFYKWRAKYGGMDTSSMKRLKELEEENSRLKKMYAEEKLKAEIIAEAMEKKW